MEEQKNEGSYQSITKSDSGTSSGVYANQRSSGLYEEMSEMSINGFEIEERVFFKFGISIERFN